MSFNVYPNFQVCEYYIIIVKNRCILPRKFIYLRTAKMFISQKSRLPLFFAYETKIRAVYSKCFTLQIVYEGVK